MSTSTKILIGFLLFVFAPLVYLSWLEFYAPKYEAARRNTYEQSAPYVQGKINQLNKLKAEYATASPEQRLLLKSVILREAGTVDRSKLPEDIKSFVNELK